MSEEEYDSDTVLQELFAAGKIKPGLNYPVEKKAFVNNVDGLRSKLKTITNILQWSERLDVITELAPIAPELSARWINKERVLIFATRGISHQHRHLMKDLEKLMPHARHGNKMERKENLYEVNEMCALRNCNKCVLFDGRLKRDLYMWISNIPDGPSVKFLVESIYTSGELKLTGNCLTGSRPLLSFDENFAKDIHYSLLKELFTQVFGVPNHHPKSQPFVDHVISFSVLDHKIWYRNYQIISEDGALAEIGPRFVLTPIKIFNGSFHGATLWDNPHYVTPAKSRRFLLETKKEKTVNRREKKLARRTDKLLKPAPLSIAGVYNTIH